MNVELIDVVNDNCGGNFYHLRIPTNQQYFFASIVESFSGLANHTTSREDKSVLIFSVSNSLVSLFEKLLNYLKNYEIF